MNRKGREIRASRLFNRILRFTVVPWLRYTFRLRAENGRVVRRVRPPFLLLPNHTCVMDPFLVNSLIPGPVHYVVTDASFRSRLVAFGLSLVGGIPKTKTMSDMDSIKNIMRVRDRGGIIGIFPEGQNTWDGHSMPLVHSTAKLAKLLKIPVVTARISGAYFCRPRWARKRRRGRVNVRFDLAYSVDELQKASPEEIDARISNLLENDEFEYNRKAQVRFMGSNRAEYLERVLFVCPVCRRIATMQSRGNEFFCRNCGYSVRYTLYGVFRPTDGEMRFDTIRDWNLWQIDEFTRQLSEYLDAGDGSPFLTEEDVRVQIGYRSRPLARYGIGRLELRPGRLVFRAGQGRRRGREKVFEVDGIRGANVQNNEHWEFYCDRDLFRVTTTDPRGCTYKWDLAVRLMAAAEDKNVRA